MHDHFRTLTSAERERLDEICRRFVREWPASQNKIEHCLAAVPASERPWLLRELLLGELELRRAAGESPSIAEYHGRFPENGEVIAAVFRREDSSEDRGPASDPSVAGIADRWPTTARPLAGKTDAPPALGSADETIPEARRPAAAGRAPALDRIGDLEIFEEISHGGMGIVYRARQISIDRTVAVKMLLSGTAATAEELERFHREAQAAANLDHPGIVPIYQVGENAGRPYLVMAYVAGPTLATRIAEGPLPPREAADLVRKIALAVEHAHAQGVVHRDLKPADVLLGESGEPRVSDFGLAKMVQAADNLSVTGQVLGTPNFMAPEQARGEVH